MPELLFRAVDGAGVLFVVADDQGRIRFVNREFSRVLGWALPDAEGKELATFLGGTFHSAEEVEFRRSVRSSKPYYGRLRALRKDRTPVVLDVSAAPCSDAEGGGFVAVFRDTTDELAKGADLQQRQRLELLGNLAGGIAHDFNNMLTAVSGFAELLCRSSEPSSRSYRYASEIEKTARRAAKLTSQLLAFSSRQVIRPVRLLLNEALEDYEETVRRLITEDIALVMDLSPEVRAVQVDPTQLEQIVLNLVVNARDAMPEGGRLTLRTRNSAPEEERRAQRTGEAEGPFSVIAVEDTGQGIDLESMSRIFEPFFTTKTDGQGTGLGLATVYGIVRQSGGFVRASSEPGGWSRFEVFLPRVEERPRGPRIGNRRPRQQRGSETILIAEDESGVRDLCREVLTMEGYEVLVAVDGGAALEVARDHDGPIHLLLTDVMMPNLPGPALAVEIQRYRPDLPVIYMSGYVDAEIRLEESPGSGCRFLPKPLDIDDLIREIRRALDESSTDVPARSA